MKGMLFIKTEVGDVNCRLVLYFGWINADIVVCALDRFLVGYLNFVVVT